MSLQYQQDVPTDTEAEERRSEVAYPVFPRMTVVLIGCYAAVFAAQAIIGINRSVLLAGEYKDIILSGHEIWRILTGTALHGGIAHILFNSYAFYSFGRLIEMLSNRWHLAVVFLLAAISGSILSLMISPHGISVGASGGIVGLVGYLTVYSFKRREFISASFRNNLIFNIGFILFYGFVLVPAVDNFAHIGGLVMGAVYGLIQVPGDGNVDPRKGSPIVEAAGIASIGIYAAICVFAILVILQQI